jgi:hypothetical protein
VIVLQHHSALSHSFKKYQAGLKLKTKNFSNKNHLKLQKKRIKCVSKERKKTQNQERRLWRIAREDEHHI